MKFDPPQAGRNYYYNNIFYQHVTRLRRGQGFEIPLENVK
jgi:hypothetical protein